MAGGLAWSRRGAARARTLRVLLRDTQRALDDVADILNTDPQLTATVAEVSQQSRRRTALVVLGGGAAPARLLHCLLGRALLPDALPRGRRWIHVQYGTSTQVHLTLGNSEFELVQELASNQRPWDTLPLEDIIRQDDTDISTVLEVEINNQFLKDGLSILIPPDLPTTPDPSATYQKLKELNADFYSKRDIILRNFNPIFLYALDRIGKNIFTDNFCDSKIVSSRSEEDFWSTFNLYYMTRSVKESELSELSEVSEKCESEQVKSESVKRDSQPYVFTPENCLDLHQIKDLNPSSQVFFILFSDSSDVSERDNKTTADEETGGRERDRLFSEATESTEDFVNEELPEADRSLVKNGVLRHKQESPIKSAKDKRRLYEERCAFMNELLDQWELMGSPPSKHNVKSQWLIIDDHEMLHTTEQKALPTLLSGAPQTTSETPLKGGTKRKDDDRVVKNRTVLLSRVVKFASDTYLSYLLEYCNRLSEVHVKLLQQFILASFDLARELQVLPRKIQYVATQEQQLYETINEKFSEGEKKQELLQIMQEVLEDIRADVDHMDWSVDDLPYHQDKRFIISNSIFYESSRISSDTGVFIRMSEQNGSNRNIPESRRNVTESNRNINESNRNINESNRNIPESNRNSEECNQDVSESENSDVEEAESYDSYNFDDYDIIQSTDESFTVSQCFSNRIDRLTLDSTASASASQPNLIHVENESSLLSVNSSLQRLIHHGGAKCNNTTQMSVKQATLDVQKNVLSKLSKRISLRLANFVDCLKDNYFGTLQRCLESLEAHCRPALGGRPASAAMLALVGVARTVQLQPSDAFSLYTTLLDSIRRLFHKLRIAGGGGGGACCVLSPVWRRQVALHTVHSLSPQRLARVISAQILERLSSAHDRYQSSLASLQTALAGRLHHTEDVKLAIRKKYAPSFARLCLESTSMCDLLMYGSPELGREIGRGQYGVVYALRGGWAGRAPAAGKSVLPADERHYHELAMEFFYTRSIPPHPRIVRVYGSIVSSTSCGPTVLLISERKTRDLHAAVRAALPEATRMRIALDIVEGIRYLHSLGLVHRDIKMKNVLLDQHDRASLTDLGFCAAEALMSGSVVGTPVHMAPELLAGDYAAAVDVYAFGILFWYLCAGSVKLPSAFEVFQNKEQLWSKVRKGLRPERLPHFTDACWEVMQSCWHPEPTQRALLGDIQPKLQNILEQSLTEQGDRRPVEMRVDTDSDDSLDMTGLDRHGFV
ncbi:dual serine/threonine and tyrosine protein kinase [Plutella xylostella]|uniref:dual serine/threonine and tyrosine protein kinase n=1 Tax=Plutella xylostella TaxID=51655 RepID=UPI002032A078|nr:dual serine/threonine and tyrosine protein kinase [Plutella xylostella]